jgi:hypothetical protein
VVLPCKTFQVFVRWRSAIWARNAKIANLFLPQCFVTTPA